MREGRGLVGEGTVLPGGGVPACCEIMENIGVFSSFRLFWSLAGGAAMPRLSHRSPPRFPVRELLANHLAEKAGWG